MEKANALKDPDEQSEFKRSNPSSFRSLGGGTVISPRDARFLDDYCHGRTLEECFEMRKKLEEGEE